MESELLTKSTSQSQARFEATSETQSHQSLHLSSRLDFSQILLPSLYLDLNLS